MQDFLRNEMSRVWISLLLLRKRSLKYKTLFARTLVKVNSNHLYENRFYCERCDNYFPTMEILRNHENHSHDDQKMRTCPYCPKVMTRMSVFYKHANEAHKEQVKIINLVLFLFQKSHGLRNVVCYHGPIF